MSYTLRQVQPLLTKPELELFTASRATAVKELTARQLSSKITRARALRDKYRDVYRRQTVATRSAPAAQRAPKGGENARTETKAAIMAEVLARFEAQSAKLQAKQAGAAGRKPTAVSPKAVTASKTPAAKRPARQAITDAAQPAATLAKAVRKAVAKKTDARSAPAAVPRARRASTRVGGTASDNAQGTVPTNMPAAAQRLNPLKAEPVNKKIHASARSRGQAAQARRDAR
ncbi:MAG: hypothetical protein Q4F13_06370 [Pseudomonadota bacterium]|nr:hypothetical protein [Pseudomonadota bacterium]